MPHFTLAQQITRELNKLIYSVSFRRILQSIRTHEDKASAIAAYGQAFTDILLAICECEDKGQIKVTLNPGKTNMPGPPAMAALGRKELPKLGGQKKKKKEND